MTPPHHSQRSAAQPGRHSRSSIVAVALRLLDDLGIADLSMRRLAGELDVQPSALYWHFENKQSLLAAVADRIVEGAALESARSAADAATRLRAALLAHRDGAEVVLSTYALGLGAGAAATALRDALPPSLDAPIAADAMLQFVLGNASVLQQRLHAQRFGVLDRDPARIREDADLAFIVGLAALVR